MAMQELAGKTIAVLAADGVEEMELVEPKIFLSERGASVNILSPTGAGKQIQAVNFMEIADKFTVDKHVGDADPNDYDLLLIPGGTWSPDFLRVNEDAVEFIKRFSTNSGLALSQARRALYRNLDLEFHKAMEVTGTDSVAVMAGENSVEGLTAFVEKRKPVWKR